MSKYYVRPDKMRKLERVFRADIRKIKVLGLRFDMQKGACPTDDLTKFVPADSGWKKNKCGVCLVAAHVVARGVKPTSFSIDEDILAAAKDLRVSEEWMDSFYYTFRSDDVENSAFPQAAKLSLRLQQYAKEIGA